jgi:hypothetical protein
VNFDRKQPPPWPEPPSEKFAQEARLPGRCRSVETDALARTIAVTGRGSADPTALTAQEQARCLRGLEQASAVLTAARTSVLRGFTAGQGYTADADYSPRAWLIHHTGITKGAAVACTAWVRRAEAHPRLAAALAAGEISESVARTLCQWTGKLPEDRRQDADKILADAAICGLDLADLAGLFAEMYERAQAEEPDRDREESFGDRALRLVTTLGGAGVLTGDLTPECAAAVGAVLDALAAPAGAEDDPHP